MTATAPRSSATSRASRSAARPSAASGGPLACPRNGAAGPPSTGRAAPGARPWAALVLIDGSPFDWLGTGPPRVPPRRHRRRHQHPPRPPPPPRRRSARLSHPARGSAPPAHGLPVTLYGDRLGVFVRNDAHWSLEEELQGAQHPDPLRAGPAGPRDRLHRRPLPSGQGPHRARSGRPCRIASSPSCASTRIQTWRGRRGLPAHLPRRPQPPLDPAPRRGRAPPGAARPAISPTG